MSDKNSKIYRNIGIGASILWLALVLVYAICKRQDFFQMNPNEFGDFLTGALGPLGILWLVLGFWQQGDELRNSVHALNLQSEELKNSVEQQKALVRITKEQTEAEIEALKEERRFRKLANSPKLVIGFGHGNAEKVRLKITNIGASCSNLSITVIDGDLTKKLFSTARMFSGAEEEFSFNCGESEFLNFYFDIHYLNMHGEPGVQRINANRVNRQTVGFNIVQSFTQ